MTNPYRPVTLMSDWKLKDVVILVSLVAQLGGVIWWGAQLSQTQVSLGLNITELTSTVRQIQRDQIDLAVKEAVNAALIQRLSPPNK